MAFTLVNQEKIHYDFSGGDHEASLILIHGSGGSSLTWPESARTLPGFNVYAIDLPGHGQSDGESRKTVAACAEWVEDFVATLGIRNAAVCGHSLGGAIAITLGLQKPSWLTKIILVGTGARLRVHPAILDGVENDFEGAVNLMGQFLYGPDASDQVIETARAVIRQAGSEVLLNDFLACDRFDVMKQAEEIQVPTLIISGTNDQLTPVKYGQFLADRIAGAQMHVIQGAGHMMALEQPEEFTAAVAKFLS